MKVNMKKNSGSSNSQEKKMTAKPKPEFSTDFIDREKYKMSETEMIQKKASLQSKHRQEAIEQLQERRKKLEMGIIDEDTRKVYQTALTSKKIDLNPPIRKNLSQMIQYERERQAEHRKEYTNNHTKHQGSDEEEDTPAREQYEKQIKETQAFIKKFQKAKKMDKIQRAVNLLTEPEPKNNSLSKRSKLKRSQEKPKKRQQKNPFQNEKLALHKHTGSYDQNSSLNTSTQEEVLSNIQQTIRFMQQRLFSAGRIEKIKKEHQKQQIVNMKKDKKKEKTFQVEHDSPKSKDHSKFYTETLQISQLKVNNTSSDEEHQCLDTIRRMKDMIDNKESHYEHSFKKMKENYDQINITKPIEEYSTLGKHTPHYAESDAEIDFSLTMNNSENRSLESSLIVRNTKQEEYFSANFGTKNTEEDEYEKIKKSLFDEVNRLQFHSFNHEDQASFQAKTQHKNIAISPSMNESSISNLRYMPTPSPSTLKKPKKGNSELQRLKNQISGMKQSVQAIKIQPISMVRGNEIMGTDFRGSFNIKKNIIQQ